MNKLVSERPLIRYGWLRALLFIICCGVGMVIAGAIFVLGLFSGKAGKSNWQEILNNHLTGMSILFVIVLTILLIVFRRWVDRKPFISIGLQISGYGREIISGSMMAVFLLGTICLILKWTDHLKWMDILFDGKDLFLAFGTIALIAFYEELVFRGYILNNLMDSFPKWIALLISTFLFMLFHWTNPASFGFFTWINNGLLGLILGMNYLYTRNLWFSFSFHAGWNYFEGPLFGFPGDLKFQTLLQTEMSGDDNITGGVNGLQSSFITTAVLILGLLGLYFILQKKLNPKSPAIPGRI